MPTLAVSFVERWGLFEVTTLARTKEEFLLRPDLGRSLSDDSKDALELSLSSGGRSSGRDCRRLIGGRGAGSGSVAHPIACR